MNRQALIGDLTRDEGKRAFVYDDADGQPIRPGSVVKGHPTIGVGRALDVDPLSEVEILNLLNGSIDQTLTMLDRLYSWFLVLDDVRQRVLVNMAFNMGVLALSRFHHMLAAIERQDYAAAADEMAASDWHGQTGARAVRLEQMMRTGTDALAR